MHIISHFITSILIAILISFKYDIGIFEYLLAILSGTFIDLDHVYYYLKYGNPKSIRKFLEKMIDVYKQPPTSGVRFHTIMHELIGLTIFLVIYILIDRLFSTLYALLIFLPILSHFLLDLLSIKMMLLSPFSQKEFYIGLVKPNSNQEKALILILLIIIFLSTFLKYYS